MTKDNDILMQVEDVYKFYVLKRRSVFEKADQVQAVRGISLDIAKGEVLAIVGESGCGKSTSARLLVNLEDTSEGIIKFKGKPLSNFNGKARKEFNKKVQMVLQDPFSSLPPRMTIKNILMEPLLIHKVGNEKHREEKVKEIASLIKLTNDDLESYPESFSGGQRQMISIGRAIILDPEIVILDEATSALDSSIQAEILNLFADLKDKLGLTYIVISHDLAVVRHMCDSIAVMYLGQFVETGSNESIFENPLHPYTKSLMAVIPTIEKELKEDDILRGEVPSPLNPPKGCSFSSRCPIKTSICDAKNPRLRKVGDKHFVACHNI